MPWVIESLIKAGALDSLGKRAPLMAAVDQAIERAQKSQRDAEHGQTGLFGLFEESQPAGRGDDLPRVAEWEEGQRLAYEKEVLGFFVSGHPMDKYAGKLLNMAGVISVSEAQDRKPPERQKGRSFDPANEIQVAGMIQGLKVQKSKRDQKLYAQAVLEDTTGKIELICFARDYERIHEQLKIETPVLIRGMLMGEEGSAPKIAVNSIQSLEEVEVRLPKSVRIRINLDRSTPELFSALKDTVDAAPGACSVELLLVKTGEYEVTMQPKQMNVNASPDWVRHAEEVMGKGSVQVFD